ncbi:[pyruvate dehydrogenase (acetyl-transferring)]-phosphatase [Trifolium repens]|nr:[pyruvate dehydrogenase (acetyl-transferring)]-phosphatase [Trifolium repens]
MKPTKKIYDQRTFIDNHRAGNHHHRTGKFDAMTACLVKKKIPKSLFNFPESIFTFHNPKSNFHLFSIATPLFTRPLSSNQSSSLVSDVPRLRVAYQEVYRIRQEHPDDPSAVTKDRVKSYLNIRRAFGAGFLKQMIP